MDSAIQWTGRAWPCIQKSHQAVLATKAVIAAVRVIGIQHPSLQLIYGAISGEVIQRDHAMPGRNSDTHTVTTNSLYGALKRQKNLQARDCWSAVSMRAEPTKLGALSKFMFVANGAGTGA